MIPKIIHYCWLSEDAYPENIKKCIESWKAKLPGYEIKLWNLKNESIRSSAWVQEAFAHKKYAFAADYIRLYALYHYGGIYLDSDVEVLRNFDELLKLPYFVGLDSYGSIEAAVLGCEAKNPWIKQCLDYYNDRHFVLNDGSLDTKTLPEIMNTIIRKDYKLTPLNQEYSLYELDECLYIHPYTAFSPKRHDTGKICKKDYTYTIHHYAMSWIPYRIRLIVQLKRLLMMILGKDFVEFLIKIFSLRTMKNRILSKKNSI